MNKILIICLCLLPLTSLYADSTQVDFQNGWIKQLPPVVPMRAAYVRIVNNGQQAMRIVSISSEAFEKVEMHESRMEGGMMSMVELDSLALPSKSTVNLQPGGKHLMLMTPQQPMKVGDIITLSIQFEDGKSRAVEFEVKH